MKVLEGPYLKGIYNVCSVQSFRRLQTLPSLHEPIQSLPRHCSQSTVRSLKFTLWTKHELSVRPSWAAWDRRMQHPKMQLHVGSGK